MVVAGRLTTAEAAAALGVKPATLYAYVSRGQLSRVRTREGSTFDAGEVTRLASSARRAHRTSPTAGLAFATAVTLIEDGRLYYRGCDAVHLSRTATFEAVAGLLWDAPGVVDQPWQVEDARSASVRVTAAGLASGVDVVDRINVSVIAAATVDPLRGDLVRRAVAATGRDIITLAVDGLPPAGRRRRGASLAERLWLRLSPLAPTEARVALLDSALVLVADHELAASTLAVRVAAAFGADPYAVVSTGLGALSGRLHGASGREVVRLLRDMGEEGTATAVGARLARGERLHGFGMGLYPQGDPRGRELLRRLPEGEAEPRRRAVTEELIALAAGRGLPEPNVDLGLGAMAFELEMVPGAAHAIIAIGRMVGWLAHAIEEYEAQTPFRARAAYVGVRPEPSVGAPAASEVAD